LASPSLVLAHLASAADAEKIRKEDNRASKLEAEELMSKSLTISPLWKL
jgi:hypothetical protein